MKAAAVPRRIDSGPQEGIQYNKRGIYFVDYVYYIYLDAMGALYSNQRLFKLSLT